jgi:pimeloyl-ACP methyl ester carboxylesterase
MPLRLLSNRLADAELRVGRLQYRALQHGLERACRVRRERVRVGDIEVPFLRAGKGPPLIAVHGFADRKETWVPLLPLLVRHFDVIAPDLLGHGEAPLSDADRSTIPGQVAMLVGLLDALGLSRVHVTGNSLGGAIAARFAHDHPERVKSLTLMAAAGPHGFHPATQALIDGGFNPLLPLDFKEFLKLIALAYGSKPPWPRSMLRHVAELWSARHTEHRAQFDRLMAPLPGEAVPTELRPPDVPTVCVYGREERIVHPRNRELYVEGLRARSLLLPGVGHIPHLEAPLQCARALQQAAAAA